jgi:hypothetical protein
MPIPVGIYSRQGMAPQAAERSERVRGSGSALIQGIGMPSESSVRRFAARRGYPINKSRQGKSCDNRGQFMLSDVRNCVVLGVKFDASIDEIDAYLKKENAPILSRWR